MLGALTSLTGGGGMSASSSASASQETANNISSGTITVGGLNMAPKQLIDSDLIVKGGLIAGGVLLFMFALKKIRK